MFAPKLGSVQALIVSRGQQLEVKNQGAERFANNVSLSCIDKTVTKAARRAPCYLFNSVKSLMLATRLSIPGKSGRSNPAFSIVESRTTPLSDDLWISFSLVK